MPPITALTSTYLSRALPASAPSTLADRRSSPRSSSRSATDSADVQGAFVDDGLRRVEGDQATKQNQRISHRERMYDADRSNRAVGSHATI